MLSASEWGYCIFSLYSLEVKPSGARACPPGTFHALPGAKSVDDCAPCAPGTYCPDAGATTNATCPEGFYCPTPTEKLPCSSSATPSTLNTSTSTLAQTLPPITETISLAADWENYGGSYNAATYTIYPSLGLCILQGLVYKHNGGAWTTSDEIASLPPSCAPINLSLIHI